MVNVINIIAENSATFVTSLYCKYIEALHCKNAL